MTDEQARWLRENPTYSVIGAGGASPGGLDPDLRHHKTFGILTVGGLFWSRVTKVAKAPGSILVGVKKTGDEIRAEAPKL